MSLTESQSLFLSNSVRDNNMMLFLLWNGILYIWLFPLRIYLFIIIIIYFLDFSYVYDGQAISLQFKLCNTAVPEYHVSWWALILDPGDTHNTRWKNLDWLVSSSHIHMLKHIAHFEHALKIHSVSNCGSPFVRMTDAPALAIGQSLHAYGLFESKLAQSSPHCPTGILCRE